MNNLKSQPKNLSQKSNHKPKKWKYVALIITFTMSMICLSPFLLFSNEILPQCMALEDHSKEKSILSMKNLQPSKEEKISANKHFQVANKMYSEGNLSDAIKHYRISIELDLSIGADAYNNLASLYQDIGEINQAEEAFLNAIQLNNKHASALFNLAMLYQDSKRSKESISLYKTLLKLEPENPDIWSNLGACEHEIGLVSNAIESYKNALLFKINDDNTSILYEHLGRAYSKLDSNTNANANTNNESISLAIESFKKSLEYNPQNEISKHMLASLLSNNENSNNIETAPPGYVRQLFDDYSSTFESSLIALQYAVPELITNEILLQINILNNNNNSNTNTINNNIIIDEYGNEVHFTTAASTSTTTSTHVPISCIIDLGCGTGLIGPLLVNVTDTLIGLDLSPKMLVEAENKGIYNHLFCGDILSFLPLLEQWRNGTEEQQQQQIEQINAGEIGIEGEIEGEGERVRRPSIRRKFSGGVMRYVDEVEVGGFGGAFPLWEENKPMVIVAADVFVYIGDLDEIFKRLNVPARIIIVIGGCRRQEGLPIAESISAMTMKDIVPRMESGQPIHGLLVVFRKI
eukprot:gene5591-11274_t